MLIGGVALFTIGKWKDIQANRREASPDQIITLRRLLQEIPISLLRRIHCRRPSSLRSKYARRSPACGSLRANVAQPAQTSYEL